MTEEKNSFIYNLFGLHKINRKAKLALVIVLHIICWLAFLTFPILLFRIQIVEPAFFYKELINKLFLIAFFYFNYFILIPEFFSKGRRLTYFLLLFLSIVFLLGQHLLVEQQFMDRLVGIKGNIVKVDRFRNGATRIISADTGPGVVATTGFGPGFMPAGVVGAIEDSSTDPSLKPPPRDSFFHNEFIAARAETNGIPLMRVRALRAKAIVSFPNMFFFRVLTNLLPSALFLVLIGGFIHLAFSFINNQHEKKSLENASLQAEINLLKSQINPHFLFNTLNSIYSQVYHKSDNAERSILKLSEILRYVIYDTNTEKIALDKDIHYLSNYIDLQRMRLPERVRIRYSVNGELTALSIAPLLLITFIENAFKHGISYKKDSEISVCIDVFDKTLTMVVSNPINSDNTFDANGVGLRNAKRRLELIYPGQYRLDIKNEDKVYFVNLQINLHRD
jgi:two-component system LytT family sensor kinase